MVTYSDDILLFLKADFLSYNFTLFYASIRSLFRFSVDILTDWYLRARFVSSELGLPIKAKTWLRTFLIDLFFMIYYVNPFTACLNHRKQDLASKNS